MDRALENAVGLLPQSLRAYMGEDGTAIEEIRLRAGRRPFLRVGGREREAEGSPEVSAALLRQVLENATRSSLHTAAESLKQGYVTATGGCRVGICGTAAVNCGEVVSLREPSSLSIRVARAQQGIGREVVHRMTSGEAVKNTLIISPPGLGKTTLLRDTVRLLSDRGCPVGLADERGEVAAVSGGVPLFDVGAHTDVMTGAPKEYAVMTLLRTMTPWVIALDEISEARDARAVELAANCGTSLVATVHGFGAGDVLARPVFSAIRERGIFSLAVTIVWRRGQRSLITEEL